MSEVLFEVTKDNLETGLRGYPVGYCTTSKADPQTGLHYREVPITKLIEASPEEVMYLIYNGQQENGLGYQEFVKNIKGHCELSESTIQYIHALPRAGHPMKLFTSAILMLGMLEGKEDYSKDGMNLLAKASHLAAVVINHHAGWGDTPPPNPEKSTMENFVDMLRCPFKERGVLIETMRLFNILHMDHGGGNLSAFIAKAISSGHEDMYGSIAGAMCALEGPLHGRANQDGLGFVKKVHESVGEKASQEDMMQFVQSMLDRHELVYGFGHAVLRVEDPRATVFYDYGQKHFSADKLFQTALKLRTACREVLKKNPKIANPNPNVDAISGTILTASGFGYPEYFTVLFGMSRIVGLVTQIIYDRLIAREGKGTPIVRPKYIYRPQ